MRQLLKFCQQGALAKSAPHLPTLPLPTFIWWAGNRRIEAWQPGEASSVHLVMDLESIRTGAPVAVPVCAREEEALRADATEGAAMQEDNQ